MAALWAAAVRGKRTAENCALQHVLQSWPEADAGIIALTMDGQHAIGNTSRVLRRGDLGSASWGSREQGALALVLHNSIVPQKSLAGLVAEVVWNAMQAVPVHSWITLRAGVAVHTADRAAVWLDGAGAVTRLDTTCDLVPGCVGLGLGDRVLVLNSDATSCGRLGHEPYIMVENGRVLSVDGQPHLRLPVLRMHPAG